ncbi:hypothetical protein Tco_0980697 [Tanacetum coccineum]
MLDHQLEICHGTVGNELTTAVQLIAFLKKQISDSKRPKVHEWLIKSTHVAEVVQKSVASSRFPEGSLMLLTFDVQVQPGYNYCNLYGSMYEDQSREDLSRAGPSRFNMDFIWIKPRLAYIDCNSLVTGSQFLFTSHRSDATQIADAFYDIEVFDVN